MILLVALAITLVVASVMFIFREDIKQDIFCPISVVSLTHLVRTIPFIILVHFDPGVLHWTVPYNCPDLQSAFMWYGFVEILGYISLVAGIRSRLGAWVAERIPTLEYQATYGRFQFAALAALTAGFLSFLVFIYRIGGLGNLVFNLEERTDITEGQGYIMSLFALATFGVLLLTYLLRVRVTPGRIAFLLLAALITAAIHSSAGGRKNTIALVLGMLIIYHYGVERLRRPFLTIGAVTLLIVPFFVGMLVVRTTRGGVEYYMNRPAELAHDVADNLQVAISNVSYVGTYVFISNYFDMDNIWLGGTYWCLAYAPIPSALYDDKPPINEGVYCKSLAEGSAVYPAAPRYMCTDGGFPPETIGIAYWNFWLPGVVVFMFALGATYKTFYELMRLSHYTFYSIVLYIYVQVNFQFTSHRISQSLIAFTALTLFIVLSFPCRVVRRGVNGKP